MDYDESGNPVTSAPRGPHLGGLAWGGADIWEFFHPREVQEEYRAVGMEPPSTLDIMLGAVPTPLQAVDFVGTNIYRSATTTGEAVADAAESAGAAAASAGRGVYNFTQLLVIGAIALAVLSVSERGLLPKWHAQARRRVRGYRRAAARRIRRVEKIIRG